MKSVKNRSLLYLTIVGILFVSSNNIYANFEFNTNEDIYVIGDIHGAFSQLVSTLKSQGIINESNDWIAGKKHLVSLGDLLDRGADSRRVLDLFRKIQQQAEQAGGKVHIVFGNHEVMNLKGDFRYVSSPEYSAFKLDESKGFRKKKYKAFLHAYKIKNTEAHRTLFDKTFPKGFFAYSKAFSLKGEYGRWILSMPFVIKINDQLFTHGGLSERTKGMSLKEVNAKLGAYLNQYLSSWEKITKRKRSIFYPEFKSRFNIVEKLRQDSVTRKFLKTENSLLFSKYGPTWYRGNALCHPLYESDKLAQILAGLKAKKLWVGHTTTFNLKPHRRLDGQLIVMDTGMLTDYYGGSPYIARVKSDGSYVLFNGLTGEKVKPYLSPPIENINPFNLSDKQAEAVLRKAKIVSKSTESDSGSEGQLLELEYDGHKFMAKFFTFDNAPGLLKKEWNSKNSNARRYHYEIAAYKIDRMLKVGLVPVTIEKIINGKVGALQVVVENTIPESKVLSKYGGQFGVCPKKDQENLRDTFGYLIQNTLGRRGESYYTKGNGHILFLRNSRSFSPSTHFTSKSRPDEIFVTAAFKTALLKLSDKQLDELMPWLHPVQIEAIGLRRDRLLGIGLND